MSFLACISACLAEFLSKPIETSVPMESSGGSVADDDGAGVCPFSQEKEIVKERKIRFYLHSHEQKLKIA